MNKRHEHEHEHAHEQPEHQSLLGSNVPIERSLSAHSSAHISAHWISHERSMSASWIARVLRTFIRAPSLQICVFQDEGMPSGGGRFEAN